LHLTQQYQCCISRTPGSNIASLSIVCARVSPCAPEDKVLAIVGVGELLKPTIDALRAKLAVLTA
jgi:hypothetical protein